MSRSLGVRLAVAAGLTLALLVPFALLAVLIVGQWAPLHTLDASITGSQHALALQHPAWVRFMVLWSIVFSPTGFRLLALGVVIWLYRRGAKRLVAWIVTTLTVGGVLGALLKLLIGRHRPDLLDPVARAAGFSFPSGHALNATLACAVFLLVFLPFLRERRGLRAALWGAVIVVPLVTGLCRIGLGVHWTSDVVAGWLLGIAVVVATATAFQTWRVDAGRRPVHIAHEGVEPEIAAGRR
ncbi:MAG TPA: phosphatase PAP2 family protein [Actinoplanes sp.]|jgi:undecaprenyl-diphosphatase